jgi:hypothetical protein
MDRSPCFPRADVHPCIPLQMLSRSVRTDARSDNRIIICISDKSLGPVDIGQREL